MRTTTLCWMEGVDKPVVYESEVDEADRRVIETALGKSVRWEEAKTEGIVLVGPGWNYVVYTGETRPFVDALAPIRHCLAAAMFCAEDGQCWECYDCPITKGQHCVVSVYTNCAVRDFEWWETPR